MVPGPITLSPESRVCHAILPILYAYALLGVQAFETKHGATLNLLNGGPQSFDTAVASSAALVAGIAREVAGEDNGFGISEDNGGELQYPREEIVEVLAREDDMVGADGVSSAAIGAPEGITKPTLVKDSPSVLPRKNLGRRTMTIGGDQSGSEPAVAPEDDYRLKISVLQNRMQKVSKEHLLFMDAVADKSRFLATVKMEIRKDLQLLRDVTTEKQALTKNSQVLRRHLEDLSQQLDASKVEVLAARGSKLQGNATATQSVVALKAKDAEQVRLKKRITIERDLVRQVEKNGSQVLENMKSSLSDTETKLAGEVEYEARARRNVYEVRPQLAKAQQDLQNALDAKEKAEQSASDVIEKWKDALAQLHAQMMEGVHKSSHDQAREEELQKQASEVASQNAAQDKQIADLERKLNAFEGAAESVPVAPPGEIPEPQAEA